VELQLVVQVCVEASHAIPAGQSVACVQPHAPVVRQAGPLELVAQLTQIEPAAPHAVGSVPTSHTPLVADEQQPDRHGTDEEHAFTHRPFAWSHEGEVVGQSAICLQPHWPPPDTVAHLWPFWLLVQVAHRPPLAPHARSSVPVWQVPAVAAEQQPPLQGVFKSQALPQVWVVELQAWLTGQLPAAVHAPPSG
jgi:hypothetical protein